MKTNRFFLLALVALMCCGCDAGEKMSYPIRQAEKVEWREDLTDSCVRDDGLSMSQVLDRKRRGSVNEAGQVLGYSLCFKAPAGKAEHGLVLDIDNNRVIKKT